MESVYGVKKLSELVGVSVRTLHLYDELGLLKPSIRTEAGYRLYSETELTRLRQILFYKELDFPLKDIKAILDDPGFDLLKALEDHKTSVMFEKSRLEKLLGTIERSIEAIRIREGTVFEDLYEIFPEQLVLRPEAIETFGQRAIEKSEKSLGQLDKENLVKLKERSIQVMDDLLKSMGLDPRSEKVQALISRHYEVTREFWGTSGEDDNQAQIYAGLGSLYLADERYTMTKGSPNRKFAEFLNSAMKYFAEGLGKSRDGAGTRKKTFYR